MLSGVLAVCLWASAQQGEQKQQQEKRGGLLPRCGLASDATDGFERLLERDALCGVLELLEVAAFEFIDGDDAVRVVAGIGEIAICEGEGRAIDFADQFPFAVFGASVDQILDGLFAFLVVAFPRDAGAAFGLEFFDGDRVAAASVGLGLKSSTDGGLAFGGGGIGITMMLWCAGALLCEVAGGDLHFLDDSPAFCGVCKYKAESESTQPPDSFH